LLRVAPERAAALALKGAEEGPGLILRLFETTGLPAEAEVQMGDWRFPVSLGGHEIKTLCLHPEVQRLREVNLLEE